MSSILFDRSSVSTSKDLTPHRLGYRIKLLSQLWSRRLQEQLEPYGLTPFHLLVLHCLWQQDGLATSDIGERLQQVGATLTGVLDRMEERDLVRRERDRNDRRVYRIWLTEAGQQLQAILPAIAVGVELQAMNGLSDTECQHLSQVLDHAIANLS